LPEVPEVEVLQEEAQAGIVLLFLGSHQAAAQAQKVEYL